MHSISERYSYMVSKRTIRVEVVYATPAQQYCEYVTTPPGSTALEILEKSTVLERFADIDLAASKVGVYSRLINLDTVMEDGDRLEIYRPLRADPKAVRRKLAKEGKTMGKSR